jgi:GT2 family glycosyltransferase
MKICAVIVTFNRVALLERCIEAMLAQSQPPDRVMVVDNASTDGTPARMQDLATREPRLDYRRLSSNTGGAGGFSEGLRLACADDFDWVWIMDDDAAPHPGALEALTRESLDPAHLYGSVAVREMDTSWVLTLVDEKPERDIEKAADVPVKAAVRFLPFLGLLVSRDLIARIGLPDAGYFIAADDVEYCMRAQRAGAKVYVIGGSRIEHPRAEIYHAWTPGRHLACLRLAPWKRYYDTRNRLLIAREYYGSRLYTQTIPGTLIRWLACLIHEKQRLRQSWAFVAGTIDGLRGLKGARHLSWNITT